MRLYKCGVILLNFSKCLRSNETFSAEEISRQVMTTEVILELYLISVLCAIGLICNMVSFTVFHYDKEGWQATELLRVLVVVDSLYLLVALLRYPLKHVVDHPDDYTAMQPYVYPLLKTFQTIAIWMVVLVTVDRYVFVCHPLRAESLLGGRSRRLLAALVVVSGFLFNLPRFLDSCVVTYVNACDKRRLSVMTYTGVFNKKLYFDLYLYALYILFLYIAPLIGLAFMNTRLIQAIKHSRSIHSGISNNRDDEHGDNNATLVLVVIVLVFVICETPELILKILTVIDRNMDDVKLFSHDLILFNKVSEVLMVINSSINFFICFTYGKRFRKVFKENFLYRFNADPPTTQNQEVDIPLHQAL